MIFLIVSLIIILIVSYFIGVSYDEAKKQQIEYHEDMLWRVEKFKTAIWHTFKCYKEKPWSRSSLEKSFINLYKIGLDRIDKSCVPEEYLICLGMVFNICKIPHERCIERGIKPAYKNKWVENGDDMAKEITYL